MRIAWLVVLGLACGSRQNPAGHAKLTAKEIYQQSANSIVKIDVADPRGERVGTGFVVDASGLIATNLHVVAGSETIKVKLANSAEFPVSEIVGFDTARDLAVLRIKTPGALPVLHIGDSDQLIPGDQVVAIGNPLGVFENTVSAGLISSIRVICTAEKAAANQCPDNQNVEMKYLQISAPISQGSSGGPLFNQSGEVVGITTGIIEGGQSINIAVPTNYLKSVLARPKAIALDDFAKQTKPADEEEADEDQQKIIRKVPHLGEGAYAGCKYEDVEAVVVDIAKTIENGAPLYNTRTKKGYEACFRIYEGTAVKWEHDSPCKGVQSAFGDGLLRATSLKSYNEKAWALRDTFDGLIEAAKEWAIAHPDQMKQSEHPDEAPPKK